MLKRLVLLSLAILALAVGAANADLAGAPRIAIEDASTPHATGGATGACSIQFYNLCRWLWVYSGFNSGDEVGVVFDLPRDCSKQSGETCMNTGFWWYWRYADASHYGYTISYNLYELDAQGCKVGPSLGTLAAQGPTERWNHYPGLGGPITADSVAIIASFDKGGLPYVATDNNVHNLADPTNCPSYVPHTVVHSVAWEYDNNVYCPPVAYADAAGPVEIIIEASFSCEPVATEDESWTGLKRLFR